MKRAGLVLVLLAVMGPAAGAYKPNFCQPVDNRERLHTYCRCLIYHPKEEFCEDSAAPLPSCCRAAEKGSKLGCNCCASVYGSKRIDAGTRGTYDHLPIVEYER